MTRQPWLTKAVIDHCTEGEKESADTKICVKTFPDLISKQPFNYTNNVYKTTSVSLSTFYKHRSYFTLVKLLPCDLKSVVEIYIFTTLIMCHPV